MKFDIRVMLLFTVCYSINASALEAQGMVTENALFKVSAEQIMLPSNEQLGWVGSSYLIEAFPDLFIGASLYGAVTGKRGGFFSIGPELTWRNQLLDNWYTDVGVYVGGGGGGGANKLVRGGLVVRPHLDVLYQFGHYQAGLSASHVSFPYGTISSNQIGLVFSSQNDFYHMGYGKSDEFRHVALDGGLGFHRIRGTAAVYHGQLFKRNTQETVTMLGARADQWVTPTTYWSVEVVGAAGGKLGGYAEYLISLGAEYPILDNFISIGGRIGMGMAGGGGAATQGGLLSKTAVNLTAHFGMDTQLSLEGGYVVAPQGEMRAKYFGAELAFDLDHPFSESNDFSVHRYEWEAGIFNYHTVFPSGSTTSIPLTASEIIVNRFFTEYFYYGVHMMYAAKGGSYGGYGAAFVSIGYKSQELLNDLSLAIEFAAGGGGGGATSVGGGALYMGNVYLDYKINSAIDLRIGAGRLQALQGELDTLTTEAMLTYSYGVEER